MLSRSSFFFFLFARRFKNVTNLSIHFLETREKKKLTWKTISIKFLRKQNSPTDFFQNFLDELTDHCAIDVMIVAKLSCLIRILRLFKRVIRPGKAQVNFYN